MTDEPLSLQVVVTSPSSGDHDLMRQGAASCAVPINMVEAYDAASACRSIAAGADLVFMDAVVAGNDAAQVVAAAREAPSRPFSVLLAAPGAGAVAFATDALAAKPSRLADAQRLVDRSIRVRRPSRVLVIDDSSTMRSIVRKILAATRFPLEVSEADEGLAALKLVRESEFDLAFLDYNMPDFSGLETLAEFKREKRRMSVVLMTSTRDDKLAERARALGAVFLKKPFFAADIDAVLCRFYGLVALNPRRAQA
jgi:CheY-like chemotaxis protein